MARISKLSVIHKEPHHMFLNFDEVGVHRAGLILDIIGAILLAADQFEFLRRLEKQIIEFEKEARPLTEEQIRANEEAREAAEYEFERQWGYASWSGVFPWGLDKVDLPYVQKRPHGCAIWGALFSTLIAVLLFFVIKNESVDVLDRIGAWIIFCVCCLALVVCSYLLAPFLWFRILWLSKRLFRTRRYYSGLGAILLLIGFSLEFIATFLK